MTGRSLRFALLLAPALWTSALEAQNSSGDTTAVSITTGVFSEAQAARGERVYREVCGACHARSVFTDLSFQRAWVGRSLFDVFRQVRNTMPYDNPGSLSRREYVDVLAFIFSLNGFPAGPNDLPADDAALRRVRIEARPDSSGGRWR
jgi:cytochrome c